MEDALRLAKHRTGRQQPAAPNDQATELRVAAQPAADGQQRDDAADQRQRRKPGRLSRHISLEQPQYARRPATERAAARTVAIAGSRRRLAAVARRNAAVRHSIGRTV